ncbi:MAG: proton-conducting transporter membrane subunit, partial [Nitrospirota bacterium]
MRYLVPYILLLPLAGAFINGVAGWRLPRRLVETIACASVGISFILSVFVFMNMTGPFSLTLGDWLTSGWFSAPIQLHVDALSITMTAMVTGVSFLIHVYSAAYMRDDPGYARYFMLLNLFVFSMLLLVLAGNLPLMFVGWEGVGFCSYALIGFWYTNPDNATAGRKAFIVTRLGDTAFGVALVWLFYFSGSTDIAFINSAAASMPAGTATFIGLLLLAGATGKSAQLPLTVWLPNAMERALREASGPLPSPHWLT